MGYNTVLTFTQALQLVGLTPCLFIIFFLLTLTRRNGQTVIPILYFASLSCSFALPLLDIFFPFAHNHFVEGGLLFGQNMLSALSFLLICQFMIGRVPPVQYWLVLAIPLIGGGQLLYTSMVLAGDDCVRTQTCPNIDLIKGLYNIFSSAMIFLLLIYYSSRFEGMQKEDTHKKHKYWLIIALIMLNLLGLAVDLAALSNHLNQAEAQFTSTMLRLAFIYLVITSLFRVFYPGMAARHAQTAPEKATYDPALDLPYVDKIKALLEGEHAYRQMRLNRAKLAEMVGIGEHHLSRVINSHFGKNFNELINSYRIDEAKQRLKNEPTQVTVIGFEVGFNSIASFNRVFKEKTGVSPSDWRANNSAAPISG